MKKENGITLIALIITIIIMLILVIVAVSFATNGGLFDRAKKASEETEREAIKEIIMGSAEIDVNNGGIYNVYKTAKNAETALKNEGKTVRIEPSSIQTDATEATLIVEGKLGTYRFNITASEIKLITGSEDSQSGGQVYCLEFSGASIYVMDDVFYALDTDHPDNGVMSVHPVAYGAIGQGGAEGIEEQLEITNLSEDTMVYTLAGEMYVIKINGDWYFFGYDSQHGPDWTTLTKFEPVENFDTSVFDDAVEFEQNEGNTTP